MKCALSLSSFRRPRSSASSSQRWTRHGERGGRNWQTPTRCLPGSTASFLKHSVLLQPPRTVVKFFRSSAHPCPPPSILTSTFPHFPHTSLYYPQPLASHF